MRRMVIGGLVVAALLGASCSSSSSDGTAGGAAPPTDGTTSAPGGTGTTVATTGGDTASGGIYVVQEAGPATLTAAGDAWTLTLAEAQPRSVYFTGATDPRAGTAPNQDVIDVLWDGGVAHDAALSWRTGTEAGTLVVTIESGAYDPATDTLTYVVRPVEGESSSAVVVAKAAPSAAPEVRTGTTGPDAATLPEGVTASTLFIDPIGQDQAQADCRLTIVNDTPWAGSVVSIDPGDAGGMRSWDQPLTDGQPLGAGQTIQAASGDQDWDCHASVGLGFDPEDYYGVYLTLRDPVFSESTWSCQAPPEIACEITANDRRQPLDMTVTLRA